MIKHTFFMSAAIIAAFLEILNLPVLSSEPYKYYEKFNNPESITYIDNNNLQETKYNSGVGCGEKSDPKRPGWNILAQDTGSGVITHIWAQYYHLPDSALFLRLIIDDKIILEAPMKEFFTTDHGVMKFPFQTKTSGAYLNNIQIPFKRNFIIEMSQIISTDCGLFWAVHWKPVPAERLSESFSLDPSPAYTQELSDAENCYQGITPHDMKNLQRRWIESNFNNDNKTDDLEISGPAIVKSLIFQFGKYDKETLDSLTLSVFYDNNPVPSVEITLADLFAASVDNYNLNSYYLLVTYYDVWNVYFPMPFRKKCKFRITNNSEKNLSVKLIVDYEPQSIDIEKYAYFFTKTNKSYPTKMNIPHPVLHEKGTGRYLGTILYVTGGENEPLFMEGDVNVRIDSNKLNDLFYFGIEDFFTGGWYFIDGTFSNPTSGCLSRWNTMYRFHVLDCIDFRNSIDFTMNHGVSNDYNGNFKTVAFYYKKWIPFWLNKDTIRFGDNLQVSGSGYNPNENIDIKLDGVQWAATSANKDGDFSFAKQISGDITLGCHTIIINDLEKPEKIFITANPILRMFKDSASCEFHRSDSILVKGYGFDSQSLVNFKIGGKNFAKTVFTDENGTFQASMALPALKEGSYKISAMTNHYEAETTDSIIITRDYNYEFEDMAVTSSNLLYSRYYTGFCGMNSSRQYVLNLNSELRNRYIELNFNLPVSDTFKMFIWVSRGPGSGKFSLSLDNNYLKAIDLYNAASNCKRSDTICLATQFIGKGGHNIKIQNTGLNEKSNGVGGEFDNILLKSATQFRDDAIPFDTAGNVKYDDNIAIYPNPVASGDEILNIKPNTEFVNSYEMEIFDITGRNVGFETSFSTSNMSVSIKIPVLFAGCYWVRIRNMSSFQYRFFKLIVTNE